MKTQWASTSGTAKHCKVNRELAAVHCPRGNPQDTQLPASISMRSAPRPLPLSNYLQRVDCIGGSTLVPRVSDKGLLSSRCWLILNLAGGLTC